MGKAAGYTPRKMCDNQQAVEVVNLFKYWNWKLNLNKPTNILFTEKAQQWLFLLIKLKRLNVSLTPWSHSAEIWSFNNATWYGNLTVQQQAELSVQCYGRSSNSSLICTTFFEAKNSDFYVLFERILLVIVWHATIFTFFFTICNMCVPKNCNVQVFAMPRWLASSWPVGLAFQWPNSNLHSNVSSNSHTHAHTKKKQSKPHQIWHTLQAKNTQPTDGGVKLVRCETVPSKHAGSDPEVFWSRPVMVITASMQPESGWIVYTGPDFLHPFQFRFSKEGMDNTVRKQPISDLDGLVRVRPKASGVEASWCTESSDLVPGRTQLAHYQFPTFRFGSILPQTSWIILCKTNSDPV